MVNMPVALESTPSRGTAWISWWPVIVGLLVLYVPTIIDLHRGLWNEEAYGHGPIVLGIVLWLFWRAGLDDARRIEQAASWLGRMLFAFGLLAYAVGRSQGIVLLEVGSVMPVAGGLVLSLQGWAGVRRLWFPVFFLVFFVPLPGFVIDGITGALKPVVSAVAELLLYKLGYPIARSGVVLSVGPYQLLIADACSGLNSMFSLSSMGLLYLHLMRYANWVRVGILLACILPVAFVANIVRVIILILITYHLGDEAGQGFLHNFAGMALFVIALTFFFLTDWLVGLLPWLRDGKKPA